MNRLMPGKQVPSQLNTRVIFYILTYLVFCFGIGSTMLLKSNNSSEVNSSTTTLEFTTETSSEDRVDEDQKKALLPTHARALESLTISRNHYLAKSYGVPSSRKQMFFPPPENQST